MKEQILKEFDNSKYKKQNREWWSKVRVGKENDSRRKLTDEDKKRIKDLYFYSHFSIHRIARESPCSKRMVQFILFPEKEKKLKENVKKEKRWRRYYSTKNNRDYMRKHRENIKNLFSKYEE